MNNWISYLLMIIAGLTIMVNLVTEVAKEVFAMKSAKTINRFATVFSVILTFVVLVAYCQIAAVTITWYMAFGFVIVGIMVAYAAMFGYDKLLSYFKKGN